MTIFPHSYITESGKYLLFLPPFVRLLSYFYSEDKLQYFYSLTLAPFGRSFCTHIVDLCQLHRCYLVTGYEDKSTFVTKNWVLYRKNQFSKCKQKQTVFNLSQMWFFIRSTIFLQNKSFLSKLKKKNLNLYQWTINQKL